MSVYDWSITAADNDDADSDINWAEGQAPSTVNGSARAMMQKVAYWLDNLTGQSTSAGSGNAYTFTSGESHAAVPSGFRCVFVANHANTGAATLNVDSIGAVTMKKYHDQDLESGDIEVGQLVEVLYDGTNFQVLSVLASEDSPTLSGLTLTGNLTMSSADVDLDGNDLIIDADGDSYLHATADDAVSMVIGASSVTAWTTGGVAVTGTLSATGNISTSGGTIGGLTAAELSQLGNINTTTISAGQWVYLGAMDQGVAITDSVEFAALDVGISSGNGVLNVNGGTGIAAEFMRTDNGQILELDGSGYSAHHTLDGTAYFIGHNSASRGLGLQVNSTTQLFINTSGNVGIGTTSPSAAKFIVDQGTASTRIAQFTNSGEVSPATLSFFGASDDFKMQASAGDSISFEANSGSGARLFLNTGGHIYALDGSTNMFDFRQTYHRFYISGTDAMWLDSTGLGIGTTSPTEALDVDGDAVRIRTSQTPASASATGTAGTICWDADYIYVCVAANTWERAALATW